MPAKSTIEKLEEWVAYFPPLTRTMNAKQLVRYRAQAIRELAIAILWGAICHLTFAMAVLAMVFSMWFGMSRGLGSVPQPWNWGVNALLILQFPILHSLLLTPSGQRILSRFAPFGSGTTLATTTYATIASLQLLALFTLWTPSGVVYWSANGWALWLVACLYGLAWIFLIKASWDAGAEVQSGLLGWLSLFRSVKPQYPPMPTSGTFKHMRHPIYLAFALTTWTVPTWTPDQILLASALTLYCALGPLAKERRFARRYGSDWSCYMSKTPYWVPRLSRSGQNPIDPATSHSGRQGSNGRGYS